MRIVSSVRRGSFSARARLVGRMPSATGDDNVSAAPPAPVLAIVEAEPDAGGGALLRRLVASGGWEKKADCKGHLLTGAAAHRVTLDTKDTTGRTHPLTLDTKYYTATVAAVVHALPPLPACPRSSAPSDPGPGGDDRPLQSGDGGRSVGVPLDIMDGDRVWTTSTVPEALVLVCDPTRDGSLDRATAYAEAMDATATATGGAPPAICLLVCAYPSAAAAAADGMKAVRKAEDWAGGHGYEAVAAVVPVSASDDAEGRTNAAADDALTLDGEPHGVGRVRAALEAHVWPGLVVKHTGGSGGGEGRGRADAGRGEGNGGGEDAAGREAGRWTGEDLAGASAAGDESTAAAGSRAGLELMADEDDEVGDGLVDLEEMMGEMARVRAAAAGASDDERRAMAAEAAMRLMAMFDRDGDFCDDDDDDDAPL